jgi:hypothetical protein
MPSIGKVRYEKANIPSNNQRPTKEGPKRRRIEKAKDQKSIIRTV